MTLRSSFLACVILALAATSARAGTIYPVSVQFSGTQIMTACSGPDPPYCQTWLGTSGGGFYFTRVEWFFNPNGPAESPPNVVPAVYDGPGFPGYYYYVQYGEEAWLTEYPWIGQITTGEGDTFQREEGLVGADGSIVNLSFFGIPDSSFPDIPAAGTYPATGTARFDGEISGSGGTVIYALTGTITVEDYPTTPEPSTVVTTAVALALLGALSFRRRLRQLAGQPPTFASGTQI